jgi:hypothetical protein
MLCWSALVWSIGLVSLAICWSVGLLVLFVVFPAGLLVLSLLLSAGLLVCWSCLCCSVVVLMKIRSFDHFFADDDDFFGAFHQKCSPVEGWD